MEYSLQKNPAFSIKGSTKGFRTLVDTFFEKRPSKHRLSKREVRYLLKVGMVYSFVSSKGIGYCGITKKRFHPSVIHFHHRDPKEKDTSIYNIVPRIESLELTEGRCKKTAEELEKCVSLSSDPHSYIHLGLKDLEDVDSIFSPSLFKSNLMYLRDKTVSRGIEKRSKNQYDNSKKKKHANPTGSPAGGDTPSNGGVSEKRRTDRG